MPALTREGIADNLKFLLLEVRKQLEKTKSFMTEPSSALLESVLARDDYIDNLKDIIQRKCFGLAAEIGREPSAQLDQLKAIEQTAVNLERIADFCENILSQAHYVTEPAIFENRDFTAFFDIVIKAVGRVEEALTKSDVQTALKICRAEYDLDRMYGKAFRKIVDELRSGENTQSLVTLIFIYRYLERMGDSLQNIGEAVISAALGEKIKIDRFWALEDSLENATGTATSEIELQPVGETRSGCKISRVERKSKSDNERPVIFKEGRAEKLRDERDSVERWQALVPGVVPKIYSYHEQGDHAAILFEFVTGQTFESLILQGKTGELDRALTAICDVLQRVWRATRTEEPITAGFIQQLEARLPDVYAVHPGFRHSGGVVGSVTLPEVDELVVLLRDVEAANPAPFSTFVHGDFNVDNLIYDRPNDRVHFIDVHRSRLLDYIQDVSVFIVSNHRLQVFESRVRQRINGVVGRFLEFTRQFAADEGDSQFEVRLALGLARSLATSTRFVLDSEFSKSMFMRAAYLMDSVAQESDITNYRVPEEALVD